MILLLHMIKSDISRKKFEAPNSLKLQDSPANKKHKIKDAFPPLGRYNDLENISYPVPIYS